MLMDPMNVKYNEMSRAIESNNLNDLDKLLFSGISPNEGIKGEASPLILACDEGFFEIAKRLVESGAVINYESESGDTPLNCAVTSSSIELVIFLVRHGADPFVKNRFGGSAYEYAVTYEKGEIKDYFDKIF
jgi:uncharacterized protein